MGKIVIKMVIGVHIFEHEDPFFFFFNEWTQTLTCEYTLRLSKKKKGNLCHLSMVSSWLVSKFTEISRKPFL